MNWKFDFSPETSDIFAVWRCCRCRGDGVQSLVCGFRDAAVVHFSGLLAKISVTCEEPLLACGSGRSANKISLEPLELSSSRVISI